MILDLVKLMSDDAYYNEEHVLYLVDKYRMLVLDKKYANKDYDIPLSNYQTVNVNLKYDGEKLTSTEELPTTMGIGVTSVYPMDFFRGEITLVSKERIKYVGRNKYLQNIIYAAIGDDNKLYLTSNNAQYKYIDKVRYNGIFENPRDIINANRTDDTQDELDYNFPLEEGLIPMVIEYVVKDLIGATYRPRDQYNNASDDLADIASFIRRYMKQNLTNNIDQDDNKDNKD